MHLRFLHRFSLFEKAIFFLALLCIGIGIFGFLKVQFVEIFHVKPQGGVYTEGINGRLANLHPLFVAPGSPESDIESLIFSGLLRYDANEGKYIPDIAESFTVSEDLRTYDFVLREGVKWHDGRDLTLEDIRYTYDLFKNEALESPWKSVFSHMTYEIPEGSNRVIFHIPDTDRFFLQNFQFPLLPKHILDSIPIENQRESFFAEHPVGAGPFRVVDILRLRNYDLVRLKYQNKFQLNWSPHIQLVDFFFYNEISELKNAGLTAYRSSPFESIPSDYASVPLSLPFFETLFYNVQNDALAAPEVRTALSMMVRLFQKELGEPIIPDVFQKEEVHDEIEDFVYTHSKEEVEEKIRELLYQGGWQLYTKEFDDGIRRNAAREKLSLRLVSLDTPRFVKRLEQLKGIFIRFGLEVNVESLPWSTLVTDSIFQKNYDLLLLNIEVAQGPDYFPYLHSLARDLISQGKNYSQFRDFEVDVLLEDAKMATTSERFDKVLSELEKRYDAFLPFIHLSKEPYSYIVSKSILGCQPPAIPLHISDRFWNFRECYMK